MHASKPIKYSSIKKRSIKVIIPHQPNQNFKTRTQNNQKQQQQQKREPRIYFNTGVTQRFCHQPNLNFTA